MQLISENRGDSASDVAPKMFEKAKPGAGLTEAWSQADNQSKQILSCFAELIERFSTSGEAIMREQETSRSPIEFELLNGLSHDDEAAIGEFFGQPVKSAGAPTAARLVSDSIIRKLGGAYLEQTVFIREVSGGMRVYAALWPWRIHPGVMTLHFGVETLAA